jgi:tetratricopeptide (TPR) repeat protein
MLDTIREYALESLAEQGAMEALQQRHASYYLAQAEQAEPELRGLDQRLWLNRLERDHDNLRAALRWALDHGAAEIAARMSGALWRFWHVNGHLHEGRQWLKQTLVQSASVAGEIHAKVICGAGALAQDQGDYAQAKAHYEQGLALYRALQNKSGIAWALNSLGAVLGEQGDYTGASALHEESLALYRALGDKWGVAFALDSLGTIAGEQGDEIRAQTLFAESLALLRELGHKQGVANTLLNMGVAALSQGDYELAAVFSEESLVLQRELDDRQGIAIALLNLGGVALAQDNTRRAVTLLTESLALCRDLGDLPSIAECLEGLAALAGAYGRVGQAARLWGAAEVLRSTSGAPLPPVERARYEARVSAARAQVDRGAWESDWARGRTRSLPQTIAEALDFSL